jgi:hypothetical protein
MKMNHKLDYVQSFTDRHGRSRHYFRCNGYPRIALPGSPGSPEFMEAYRQAVSQVRGRTRQPTPPSVPITRNGIAGIYFASCRQNGYPIKIGYSKDIKGRIKELQTSVPWPLEVLATTTGDLSREIWLHGKFAHLRMQGEWFRREPDLVAYIEQERRRFGDWDEAA